mmetsp:Transcript_4048/g.9042  ORF Transcript_4048/g.9042 Transcript_4048/m.9042 type:complete len:144 (+) Transcript_4048:69-500(+)
MKKSYELISLWLVHNFFLGVKFAVWVTRQQKKRSQPPAMGFSFCDMPLSLSPHPLPLQAIKPPQTTWATASSLPPVRFEQRPCFWGQERLFFIFFVFIRPQHRRQHHCHRCSLRCSVPILYFFCLHPPLASSSTSSSSLPSSS